MRLKQPLAFSVFLLVIGAGATIGKFIVSSEPLPTGKQIVPAGAFENVGSFPCNMRLSPDGRFVIVTDSGARQQLSVLDAASGKLVGTLPFNKDTATGKEQLYFGLAFGPDGKLYVSRGGEDKISIVDLDASGKPTLEDNAITVPAADAAQKEPSFVAGLAFSADGKTLYAGGNETYFHKTNGTLTGGKGRVFEIDLATGAANPLESGGFPLDVATASGKAFVTSERDNVVDVYDAANAHSTIQVGASPTMMVLDHARSHLYVSNSNSDTVSVVDTASNQVIGTIVVAPLEARGLPGCTPLGLALSPDEKTLYVALADMSAVAVVDTAANKVRGYIPAGWYPTSVVVSNDGTRLFVANAKGMNPRIPNPHDVNGNGTYIENILEGTVSMVDLVTAQAHLADLSRQVIAANRFLNERVSARNFFNPHPKHVIYIIKENRTYDNVLGDLAGGNGDKSICLFPREVTPNLHALAHRFGIFDNFYVCGEVSADGWDWSTAGMASEYTERNTRVNYSGRGRDYDFSGQTNGFPNDDYGVRDVAEPAGGYLWDAAEKSNISFRNYGFFVNSNEPNSEFPFNSRAAKKILDEVTDHDYREFDMAYADSDAWVKLGTHSPKQMIKFGSHDSPSRFTEWRREWDEYVRNGHLPQLVLIGLPRDHTTGTASGHSAPQAMVADNDYAVGEIVEAVSYSAYWKDTVICILEDDAQSGRDHVDCHRSPALIISPYSRRNNIDHRFWNTDSMLRTIEELLGMQPMCQYDGFASPIDTFSRARDNAAPYNAIMPSADILNKVNTPRSYRAKDSERMIARFHEESKADVELNDILWGAIKGVNGR